MTPEDVDLLVIGAGPAGSLVASLVRRENSERRVLVLEKETFPRHHIGESSIPSWRNILDRAGVLPTPCHGTPKLPAIRVAGRARA
jgi:flavin-dependent dehydrogenase